MCNKELETERINPVPAPLLTEAEDESMNSNSSNVVLIHPAVDVQPFPSDILRNIPKPEAMLYPFAMMYPPYPPFFPFSYPYMPCYKTDATATSKTHSVVKPITVHSTSPINFFKEPSTTLVMVKEGVSYLGKLNMRSDQLVRVQVEIPKRLSGEERKLIEELASLNKKLETIANSRK